MPDSVFRGGDGLRVRHGLRARTHPRSSQLAFGVGRVSRLVPSPFSGDSFCGITHTSGSASPFLIRVLPNLLKSKEEQFGKSGSSVLRRSDLRIHHCATRKTRREHVADNEAVPCTGPKYTLQAES